MTVAAQPNWFEANWPFLLGAAVLHLAIAGLFGLTMLQMQRNTPPPQLAIQAVVINAKELSRPKARKAREAQERAAAERKRQEEADAAAKREQEARAEEERQETLKRQEQEREQERVKQEQVVREREAQEQEAKVTREKAAEAERKQAEADKQRKLEAEQKAEAERKRVAEIERKQREREAAERRQAEADAKARQDQLRQQLEEEEGVMQARASGAMSQYQAMLQQHIERHWNRPPSARSGIQCKVSVSQSPTGTVLRAQVGECNGDLAVKQSIEMAVQKASPLPLPKDPRLFERNLNITFQPAD